MHHSMRKYAQRHSLPSGSELPRGGVSSKDGQPSGETIISAYKQKDGSAIREEETGEMGMKRWCSLPGYSSSGSFWKIADHPNTSSDQP